MPNNIKIRWGWLKFMYYYTIFGAGLLGLAIVVFPETVRLQFGWPAQDPIVYGVTGSVWFAFGLLSVLGLKSPLKFVPVLFMQLSYKLVWLIGVVIPLLAYSKFPVYSTLLVLVMISYIIGDLIAIPFSYIFSKDDISKAMTIRETP